MKYKIIIIYNACYLMISPLITLIQDYSYDKTLKLVDCYKSCVVYSNTFECVKAFSLYYNYRNIPNITRFNIYSFRHPLISHRLPKRYIYSNI